MVGGGNGGLTYSATPKLVLPPTTRPNPSYLCVASRQNSRIKFYCLCPHHPPSPKQHVRPPLLPPSPLKTAGTRRPSTRLRTGPTRASSRCRGLTRRCSRGCRCERGEWGLAGCGRAGPTACAAEPLCFLPKHSANEPPPTKRKSNPLYCWQATLLTLNQTTCLGCTNSAAQVRGPLTLRPSDHEP